MFLTQPYSNKTDVEPFNNDRAKPLQVPSSLSAINIEKKFVLTTNIDNLFIIAQNETIYNNSLAGADIRSFYGLRIRLDAIVATRYNAAAITFPTPNLGNEYLFQVVLPDRIESVYSGNQTTDQLLFIGDIRKFQNNQTNWTLFTPFSVTMPLNTLSTKNLVNSTLPEWPLKVINLEGKNFHLLQWFHFNFFCTIGNTF